MQAEQLQNLLWLRRQPLQFIIRFFRRRDFHQLHFVELMHAYDPARLAPGGTGFATETRRVSDKFLRKVHRREDFFAMKIRQWYLGRRREKQFAILQSVHFWFTFRQLTCRDYAIS